MKHSRVKTRQGLLWSLLGILLYVLAHGIPEWSAPYAVPGRLELSLTLAGLALLLAGAVRSYRASGAGAFAGAEQAAEKAFGCLQHCHEQLEDGIYERATKEIPKRNGEKLQRIARGVNAALHLHGNMGAEQHV